MQIAISRNKKGSLCWNIHFVLNQKEYTNLGSPSRIFAVADEFDIYLRNFTDPWGELRVDSVAAVTPRKTAGPVQFHTFGWRMKNDYRELIDPLSTMIGERVNQIDVPATVLAVQGAPVEIKINRSEILETIENAPPYVERNTYPQPAATTIATPAAILTPNPVVIPRTSLFNSIINKVNTSGNRNEAISEVMKALNHFRKTDTDLVFSGKDGDVVGHTRQTVTLT